MYAAYLLKVKLRTRVCVCKCVVPCVCVNVLNQVYICLLDSSKLWAKKSTQVHTHMIDTSNVSDVGHTVSNVGYTYIHGYVM